MVIIGIDAHKYTHTVVAVDAQGRQLASKTIGTTTVDHLALLTWARRHGEDLLWAVEDCRQLSRRLERDLLAAGQSIVRVPPKLMTNTRDAARSFGKSDPIDALAVARAALREPDLPAAHLDGPERDVDYTGASMEPPWVAGRSAGRSVSHIPAPIRRHVSARSTALPADLSRTAFATANAGLP